MSQEDRTIENLLELDDVKYVIDENLGLWVKFEAKKITPSRDRPHGIKYSLTLHDRTNKRIMGFDNSHAIEYGAKKKVSPTRVYDHWHRDSSDMGRPYKYETAGKLTQDFWKEVEKVQKRLEEMKK